MIVVFSGTGNSLYVANQLSGHLGDEIFRLPVESNAISPRRLSRVIWVFPVYSWGVPPVVLDWIGKLSIPGAENVPHHAVITCGDDIGLADKMWRKATEKRGWKTTCVHTVQMPNTYVLMKGFDVDAKAVEEEKIKAAVPRCQHIAERIDKNPWTRQADVVRGGFAWIKTHIIYPYFVRFEMSPKPFHSTDACVGCGKCSQTCPLKNIKMKARRPHWGENCALCLGCYHACPHHAVAYGTATENKGQKEILR